MATSNALPPELTEADLVEAIDRSGYPVQTSVAAELSSDFTVFEEWGYRDRFSGKVRALDLVATWPRPRPEPHEIRIRPKLGLLIECKKSRMPYVFFLSERGSLPPFPLFAGLHDDTIELTTDDDMSQWHFDVATTLWLWGDPLVMTPPVCSTFSKCERKKNGKPVLSGSDPYMSLTMPLMSAVEHFRESKAPVATALWFDLHAVLPVAVIDGPMRAVRPGESRPTDEPWVRLLRHEPDDDFGAGGLIAFDVVQRGFLPEYVNDYVLPYANRFAALARKHHEVLASGKGFVRGLGAGTATYGHVEPVTKTALPPVRVAPTLPKRALARVLDRRVGRRR